MRRLAIASLIAVGTAASTAAAQTTPTNPTLPADTVSFQVFDPATGSCPKTGSVGATAASTVSNTCTFTGTRVVSAFATATADPGPDGSVSAQVHFERTASDPNNPDNSPTVVQGTAMAQY